MKRISSIIIFFVLFFTHLIAENNSLIPIKKVNAIGMKECSEIGMTQISISPRSFVSGAENKVVVSFNSVNMEYGDYYLTVHSLRDGPYSERSQTVTKPINAPYQLTFDLTENKFLTKHPNQEKDVKSVILKSSAERNECLVGTYEVTGTSVGEKCRFIISQQNITNDPPRCFYPGCIRKKTPVLIVVEGLTKGGNPFEGKVDFVLGQEKIGDVALDRRNIQTNSPGTASASFMPNESGSYTVKIEESRFWFDPDFKNCNTSIIIRDGCGAEECTDTPRVVGPGAPSDPVTPFELCAQIEEGTPERLACNQCAYGDPNGAGNGTAATGIWTAVGCIPTNATSIVQVFIKIGLSIAGGVALLMILISGFMLTTSQGDPKRANEAKELLTSAVIGLLFIIFSVTMLQFIGVRVLQIPGFGTT